MSGAHWEDGSAESGHPPYACEDALRRLDDYLDRQLPADEARRVEAHLAVCAACASKYRFERRFVAELRRKLRRFDIPSELADRIHRRLVNLVNGDAVA